MKRFLFCTTIALLIPMMMNSQTYSSLWKQVRDAESNDLPQTAQRFLRQIAAKADKEKNYGQLLKAELKDGSLACEVSPDSLLPAVERLKQREEQAKDTPVLQAVYQAVLAYLYANNRVLDEDNYEQKAEEYYDKALSRPDLLAQTKAGDYDPFVVKGTDSRLYADDMLSVIGYMARRYELMRSCYLLAGNRHAALMASLEVVRQSRPEETEALNKSPYLERLDSLIKEYSDLPECGEVALERYDFMSTMTTATAEQKWQYINMALDRWGAWPRMNRLRNSQRDLSSLQYHAEADEHVTIPQRQQAMQLTDMRGISELTMRIYRAKVSGGTDINPSYSEDYKKLKPLLTLLPELTQTRRYVGKRPYELFDDTLAIPALPAGVYMIETESQPATQVARTFYFVSDVRVLVQPQPAGAKASRKGSNEQLRLVAVNATTGQPLAGATVAVTHGYGRYRQTESLHTDERGECIYEKKQDSRGYTGYTMRAYTKDDDACPAMSSSGRFTYNGSIHAHEGIDIYTDRSIYRPGQTVHVAAILYANDDGMTNTVLAGKKVHIALRDANYKVVEEKDVTTDDYGTCAALLTLPRQGLTGSFSIHVNGSRHHISVEEYKRPAFEVEIPRVSQGYEDGDTVVARGTARSYAGVPVQGAKVRYTVRRQHAFWWMSYSRYWGSTYVGTGSDDDLLAEGETTTDEKGQFTVDMPMVMPKLPRPMFFNFVLTADVTDQAGETHQGTLSLPLGNRKTAFSATMPEKVLNEGDTRITFHLQNAAGADMEGNVRYRFESLSKKESATAVTKWAAAKTNALVSIPKLSSGRYRLVASVMQQEKADGQNEAAETEETLTQDFVVFSIDDRRPAVDTCAWFYTSHERFPLDGTPVTVQAGSSEKNVHVVYSVISGDSLMESGTAELSNELINRKFTYQEAYGNGVLLTFAWMKDGKAQTYATLISRPLPDMHLDMKWKTFRNRLTPGQQEEWTLSITKPDGTPADAQLTATLYDKSLDQLSSHHWSLLPYQWLPTAHTQWQGPAWGILSLHGTLTPSMLSVAGLAPSHFDYDIFPSYYNYYRRNMRFKAMSVRATNVAYEALPVMEEADMAVQAESSLALDTEADILDFGRGNDEGAEGQSRQDGMQLRENLQETAFFMPQLVCDTTGTVSMKFTLPESLTTWRFLAVAHTKDMMYGQTSDEAVARKDVMIQPNMPRFLRQGDQATISARVMNMSEKPISGTALLQLLDPETEKVVMEMKQQVTVADSSTIGIDFRLLPADCSMQPGLLIVRMSIVTPSHSDGEQHYLPILPNTERITVTVPFTQNGPGTKEIDLTKLIPASASQASSIKPQVTIEYTNNPVWLMIQALPAVGHPHDDCAICQASSYYANSIGRHILNQNPTAKHVFEQWQQERANSTEPSTLDAQLEKDQELKDLLLNETPWVADADRETEQRRRLADFFDQNLTDQRLKTAVDKLRALQKGNGSWSWWPGMDGSVYMTTAVTEMLVRLNDMTGTQNETESMLSKAFKFLGDDIVEMVNEMKRQEKKGIKQTFPSRRALQWLYLCAIDGRQPDNKVREANDYLIGLLKKDVKNQTIMEKALSAIVLNNKTYIKSLKEFTVYREDMGRYYDTQRAGYSWRDYKIPTQVAAIEALKRLTPQDTVTITEMQRWLLQQKRTQAWDTPINSADAIYAFLNGNSQALAPQPKTMLSIDDRSIETSHATAGIGFVKTTQHYDGEKRFTAAKTSTGTSWGAVYAQFMQPATDVISNGSGLTVKREVMTARADAKLYPLTAPLKVGDRVTVRITIDAERDFDFVQVQDKRAACMEPVNQHSGYQWREGCYCTPKDNSTSFFFSQLHKGRHVIEREYYIDREGTYQTGTCTVQCAYSPEFRATAQGILLNVEK